MFYILLLLGLLFLFFLLLRKIEMINTREKLRIITGLKNHLEMDNLQEVIQIEYDETLKQIVKQEAELDNSLEELREYKKELELTYDSLLSKSTQLEYSNQFLEKRVANLSNLNSISRSVLSIFELDKIINIILDAYFVLTGAKRISLYLWDEEGNLLNKKIKGSIRFQGTVSYSPELLKKFGRADYERIYQELGKGFTVLKEEKLIISPLSVNHEEMGVIYIIEDRDKMIDIDEEMMSALGIQIGTAIKNARAYYELLSKERISQELAVASRIQNRILPEDIHSVDGLQIAKYFKPAKEIGGDYYDYGILRDNIFFITIADVSGKGVPAAFLMALGRSVLKTLMDMKQGHPSEEMKELNQLIYEDITEEMFITMLHSKYDLKTKTLTFSNAGHNPLLVYKAAKDVMELHTVKGVALGFLENYSYREASFEIEKGDIVVFYTDGITEAENTSSELFGIERLKDVVYNNRGRSAEKIKEAILNEITSFRGEKEQVDDITFVILKSKK